MTPLQGWVSVASKGKFLMNAPWTGLLPFPISLPFPCSGAFYKFTSQINLLALKFLSQGLLLAQFNPRQHAMTKHGQINLGTEKMKKIFPPAGLPSLTNVLICIVNFQDKFWCSISFIWPWKLRQQCPLQEKASLRTTPSRTTYATLPPDSLGWEKLGGQDQIFVWGQFHGLKASCCWKSRANALPPQPPTYSFGKNGVDTFKLLF